LTSIPRGSASGLRCEFHPKRRRELKKVDDKFRFSDTMPDVEIFDTGD